MPKKTFFGRSVDYNDQKKGRINFCLLNKLKFRRKMMSKKKQTKQPQKQRNLLHDHPLLKKGGVHEKTEKADRQKNRISLRKEWFSQITFVLSAI